MRSLHSVAITILASAAGFSCALSDGPDRDQVADHADFSEHRAVHDTPVATLAAAATTNFATGACPDVLGSSSYCDPDCICDEGEGDCDGDQDCAEGLVCMRDMGAVFGFDPDIDICMSLCPELGVGTPDFCSPECPCEAGQGDCDDDGSLDCVEGTVCLHNVGSLFGYESSVDVCIDECDPLLGEPPESCGSGFSDSFDTDTTGAYNWLYVDPYSQYSYSNQSVWITLTDDWPPHPNAPYKGRIAAERQLAAPVTEGTAEFAFKPVATHPWGAVVSIAMYDSQQPENFYRFSIGRHDTPAHPYPTHLQKSVGASLPVDHTLHPTPSPYLYSMNQWHRLTIEFDASGVTGYLDGAVVVSGTDPSATAIAVDTVVIMFIQQDQYLDDIDVQGQ